MMENERTLGRRRRRRHLCKQDNRRADVVLLLGWRGLGMESVCAYRVFFTQVNFLVRSCVHIHSPRRFCMSSCQFFSIFFFRSTQISVPSGLLRLRAKSTFACAERNAPALPPGRTSRADLVNDESTSAQVRRRTSMGDYIS